MKSIREYSPIIKTDVIAIVQRNIVTHEDCKYLCLKKEVSFAKGKHIVLLIELQIQRPSIVA